MVKYTITDVNIMLVISLTSCSVQQVSLYIKVGVATQTPWYILGHPRGPSPVNISTILKNIIRHIYIKYYLSRTN